MPLTAGPVARAQAALERAQALQPELGAFVELTPQLALAQARQAEEELAAGRSRGPLHGVPVAIKDVIDVAGLPTRLGAARPDERVAERNALVVDALLAAGAVIIGKTATHELALGMITPGVHNPHDPTRIAGGSSGGSAVAVAAGIVALALGTDTNGSVRVPASHCGVVGLRPTRGALPREGVAPLAFTQDAVGLLAPDAESAAAAWGALVPGEPAGEGRRVGVDRAAIAAAAPEVGSAVGAALERSGLELVDVVGPDLALCASASLLAIEVEAAAAWGEQLDRFGPRVRGALRAGLEVPRGAYLDAKRARAIVCERMRALFARERLDALALPTVPVTATPADVDRVPFGGRDRSVESLQGLYAAPASLTGQPAVSVPCGTDADGMPVGLQLLGRAGADAALLGLASRVGITSNN